MFLYTASVILTITFFATIIPISLMVKNEITWSAMIPSFSFFQTFLFTSTFQLTFAAFGVRDRLRLLNNYLR